MLTAYDGQSITYDASGNPTSYYNGTRWTFGWTNGRRLATATDGTTNLSYTYDTDGLRTSKTVDGVKHTYLYAGGKLLRETYGNDTLDFFYDNAGSPYALKYNGTTYYYITNLQGDVMSIVDAQGATVASYQYDPYGNVISSSGDMAAINPLRYRGYYYDTDSGLYYLQSRYYDPELGRFINADALVSTGQGLLGNNMFAYCMNSPTNGSDPCGTCFHRSDFWNDCEKCKGETIGTRLYRTLKIMGRIAESPFKALSVEVGFGVGVGAKAKVVVNNVPIEVSAVSAVTDSVSYEKGNVDFRNTTSNSVGINVAEVFDFSYASGHSHSYFDNRCTCSFMESTVGQKSSCAANQSFVSSNATLGFSVGGYLVLGGEFSIVIDFAAWEQELYSIYQESVSY